MACVYVEKFTDCAEWGPGRHGYPNKKYPRGGFGACIEGIYAIVPTKIKGKRNSSSSKDCYVIACEGTSGVDSLGRKYEFLCQNK